MAVLTTCSKPAPPPSLLQRIDQSLTAAAGYLTSLQDPDGAFRSRTYAAFKDGYSLSPLALTALRFAPGVDPAAYARGVDFVATVVGDDGALRSDAAGPHYPLYSIAGAVLVLNVPDNSRHERARQALIAELRRRQLTEDRGWQPDDPAYGGWGYFAEVPDKGASADPLLSSNISATVFAIGALRLAGVNPDDPALVKARVFVERCQNWTEDGAGDGGFFFSPTVADANKAGPAGDPESPGRVAFRSYGSATSDGLRALVRLGVPVDHPRVVAAAAWLHGQYTPGRNPGEFVPQNELRRESAYFYYLWTSTHALRALGRRELPGAGGAKGLDWPAALAEELLSRQKSDGSWANPYTELREDDPVLATSFAVAALAIARATLQGEYRSHSHFQ